MRTLSHPEVKRFVPPPPDTLEGFDTFIAWAVALRMQGHGACFSVLPLTATEPAGLMSLRKRDDESLPWNWGFIFGTNAWGSGLFQDAARQVLSFAFNEIGLATVEAWSPLANGRAHGALAKLGAEPALHRNAQAPDGRRGDYIVWTLSPSTLRHV